MIKELEEIRKGLAEELVGWSLKSFEVAQSKKRVMVYFADNILRHLAKKGVMIQTEKGMIALKDLLK